MKDYGLVSVITPSYNCSQYVAETIESILAQTYVNWELLITDDCSTDNSCEIIEQYVSKDPRIKLFRLDLNSGAGVARNYSINEAKGRFIAFCDSDDCWKSEKLEIQLGYMAKKNIEVCHSSYLKFDENNNILGIVVASSKISYKDIIQNDYVGFSTCIYDTERIGKIYMPKLRKRQDWAWKILLMENCPMAYGIIDPLVYYRVRKGSLSKDKMRLIRYNIAVYRDVLKYNIIKAWFFFLFVFMPHYFFKKMVYKLTNK